MTDSAPAQSFTFEPTITVLTAEPAQPQAPDLTLDSVLGHFPGLAPADAICWTGSTAAGWGNPLSDVDLYAFSDDELRLPVDDTMETWPGSDKNGVRWTNWMGRFGDSCVDLKVWRPGTIRQVLAAYLDGDEPEFCGLSDAMQDFVYRVSIGVALSGSALVADMRQTVRSSSYHRALARTLKATAENQLTDVAGQLAAGDTATALLTAGFAAFSVADQCLILAGQLCRRRKWLIRRLAETPECGIGVDEYVDVVHGGPRDGESDAERAERIARWAQYHLVRTEPKVLSHA